MTIVSSPGWVDAAAMTGRPSIAAPSDRERVVRSAGGAGTSSLRLPVVAMRGAPSSP